MSQLWLNIDPMDKMIRPPMLGTPNRYDAKGVKLPCRLCAVAGPTERPLGMTSVQ